MRRAKTPLQIRAKQMRQKRRREWFKQNIVTAEEIGMLLGAVALVFSIFAYSVIFTVLLP